MNPEFEDEDDGSLDMDAEFEELDEDDDPDDSWTLGAISILEQLLTMKNRGDADAFIHERFLDGDKAGGPADVFRAAHVVAAVVDTLASPSDDGWKRLDLAWQSVAYDRRAEIKALEEGPTEEVEPERSEREAPLASNVSTPQPQLPPWTPPSRDISAWSSPPEAASVPEVKPDETSALDPAMFAHLAVGSATPFSQGPHDALPPSALEGEEDQFDLSGGTGHMDAEALKKIAGSFPLPVKLPMPLEDYAALVARTESASEEEVSAVNSEFGVSDASHRARIDEEFSSLFQRAPDRQTEFESLLTRWREWLRNQK